jgi:hypothetical protein
VNPGLIAAAIRRSVFDCDRVAAERGLMGKGDDVLAGVGSDELFEEPTVDFCRIPAGRRSRNR